jgi:hypothetical protein
MLTIKRDKKSAEKVVVDKAFLKIMLSGTVLDFLTETNELCPNTLTDFPEIIEKIDIILPSYGSDGHNSWNVFAEFINKKTVFHESRVIQEYDDTLDLINQYVPESMVMDRLRLDVINDHIPLIIRLMGLEPVYEQLIFYEYIYKSENTSYVSKLKVMLENQYTLLISMLEHGDLEICTTAKSEDIDDLTMKKDLMCLRLLCNDDKNKLAIFTTFVEVHSNWLGVSVEELCQTCELIFYNTIQKKLSRDMIVLMVDQLPENIKSKGLTVSHLCLLNTSYQQNPLKVISLLQYLIPLLGSCTTQLDKTFDEQILLYQGLDLIVRLMEDDVKCINMITKRQQTKIFSLWLRMSNPVSKCFSRSNPYPYHHYNPILDTAHGRNGLNRIRNIVLSPMIRSALGDSFLTFVEMGYILSADRLDMFEIVCRNIDFKVIHNTLFTYMSPKILKFAIEKSKLSNETQHIESPDSITINVYNLIERDMDMIRDMFTLFNQEFTKNIQINYTSVINRYDFVECAYIMMYWDYMSIFKNDQHLIKNITEIVSNIDGARYILNDSDLDMVMLKTALDNTHENKTYMRDFNKYINTLKNKKEMFTTGPNFGEIKDELNRYSVKNLDFLTELCLIQKDVLEKNGTGRQLGGMEHDEEKDPDGSDDGKASDEEKDSDISDGEEDSDNSDEEKNSNISDNSDDDENDSDDDEKKSNISDDSDEND